MKHGKRALVLLLSVALILTACIPATLAGQALEAQDAGAEPAEADVTEPVTEEPAEPAAEAPAAPEETAAEAAPEEDPAAAPADTAASDPADEAAQETGEPAETAPEAVYTIDFDLSGGFFPARNGGLRLAASAAQESTQSDAPAEDGSSVTANVGQDITLPDAPSKDARSFAGWRSARTGAVYAAGGSYTVVGSDTLTAQWNMLQLLAVDAEPESGSALNGAERVDAPISEADQQRVETAVGSALGGDVAAMDILAADISFVGASGEELQPAAGESVPVALTVPGDRIDGDAAFLVVYHMAEQADGSYTAEPVQYAPRTDGDQTLRFGAAGFSIYAVASVGKKADDAASVLIQGNGTSTPIYELEEENHQVFFYQDDNAANYTYHRYTWTVEGNDDIVRAYSTSIYHQDQTSTSDNKNNYQYPWLSVDALRPGAVTVTVNYYCYNGSSWWNPYSGQGVSGTAKFTLLVTEKSDGLAIENYIPEDGTLKPVWRGTKATTAVDHYVWSKEYFHTYNNGDGSPERHDTDMPIDEAALQADGSINVSIDAGGMAQEVDSSGRDVLCVKTYTCTAYDENDNVIDTATHRVEYGEDVLNGSFEYPKIPSGTGYAFANGTRQLFWRTTAPGDGSTLGMDVELGNDSAGNPYLTANGKANDGTQYAELNAEKAGTLYQDVLTSPGATLSWSFAHRSRQGTGTNVMYLVIAASKDAKNVTNQTQINALVRNYRGDGLDVTYNGGIYKLWKFEGNPYYWQDHFGTYTVPAGQYSTRFFFASASGTTLGNLIDGIHFNESMRYVVEYYLNGARLDSLTEISTAEADSVVTPEHTGASALQNAFMTRSTINGNDYGGVTLSIKSRNTEDSDYVGCQNVLRLYYTTGTVSVRKVVEIEGWDDMTDAEKAAVNGDGYTANFELYDGTEVVANAAVTIDLIEYAQKTGVAVFMDAQDSTKTFAPAAGHDYRVVETATDPLDAGGLSRHTKEVAYAPAAEGGAEGGLVRTDGAGTGSCTVTNTYRVAMTTLTIQKQGWQPIDENQTFVYRVRGADADTEDKIDLTVTVHGNGSVTICDLPTGKYQVAEIISWSWRYTPENEFVLIDLDGPTTVTFNNTRASEAQGGIWRWLNGGSWADNRWLNGERIKPDGEEGGEQNG